MYLFQQVPQSYLNCLKSGKKKKIFSSNLTFLFWAILLHLGETPLCRTLMSFSVLGAIFKKTSEDFSQAASKGKPILSSPHFHDERKEWVGIFLRKKKNV